MTREHLDQVLQIERLSFANPWSRGLFSEELTSHISMDRVVLWEEPRPRVIGFCCLWLVAGEAQVQNLAVHPDARRKGVGRFLLLSCLTEARQGGATCATLEVRAGNLAARDMYASLGFKKQGIRPNYYWHEGEDAILLGCELN